MSAYERRQLLTDQQFSCTMDESTHEISKYTFNVECPKITPPGDSFAGGPSITKGAVYSFLEGLMVKICPELLSILSKSFYRNALLWIANRLDIWNGQMWISTNKRINTSRGQIDENSMNWLM